MTKPAPRKAETMIAVLNADDWRTIVHYWDLYRDTAFRGDEPWASELPGLVGYLRTLSRRSGIVSVAGPIHGFVLTGQWAAKFTLGTAADLKMVMTRLVPQISAADPHGRRVTAEAD